MKSENKIIELIEGLARMIKGRFDETPTRSEMNEHFEAVDVRFDKVDDELTAIKNVRIGGHNNRLDKIESGD